MNKLTDFFHTLRRGKSLLGVAAIGILLFLTSVGNSGCGVYRFADISIPDSIKTVKVNFFENRAPYVNPQLSPQLTDAVRQKIVAQTKLGQTNDDNADWLLNGTIINYSVSTAGVSNGVSSQNRLTVTVHIVRIDQKGNDTKEYDISRNYDFDSQQSITEAELALFPRIIKDVTDDIFNRIFSDW
ncbi:MAG: LptE family protein [Chitinophagaceae bacterium]